MICYIYRRREGIYFSIEKIFGSIAAIVSRSMPVNEAHVPYSRLLPQNIIRNLRYVSRLRADLFHITGDAHYLALGLPGRRTVLTIHDCVFMYQSSGIKRKLLQWLFLKAPVARCAVITAISAATKTDIIRFTGCSPDKIVVIPNPVSEAIVFRKKEFPAHAPLLLFIGSTPNKNLSRVIEAIKGMDCCLHVIGIIPPEEQQQMDNYGIKYRCSWQLSETELAECYAESDIVVFPSTFEGFGLPVIEAQRAGRPVVTSHISPLQEVAGEGACLVDPYDTMSIRKAIEKLVSDATYRQETVQKGFINVQQYTKEAVAERYMDVYKKMN